MRISDEEITSMLRSRSERAEFGDVRATVIAAIEATPRTEQIRPDTHPSLHRPSGLSFAAATIFAVAVLVFVVARLPLVGGGAGTVGAPSPGDQGATAPTRPSDQPSLGLLTTCPVTPLMVANGGSVTAQASGVSWEWEPGWTARVPKAISLSSLSSTPQDANEISAVRLRTHPSETEPEVLYPGSPSHPRTFTIGLPDVGCWLLVAIGPHVHSSVVIEASTLGTPPGNAVGVPTTTASSDPPLVCPISPTRPDPQAAESSTSLDGDVVWYTHPESWLYRQEDKLVIVAGFQIAEVIAIPVAQAPSEPSFMSALSVVTEPLAGSGAVSMGIDLPSAGCWVFSAVGQAGTSTVVASLQP